ncbi:hypothetical protein [Morganella morganii]|uniref:hypothetical protein n=1 Tax=Morganella morganii TaxID=582 RepID=UPI0034D75795
MKFFDKVKKNLWFTILFIISSVVIIFYKLVSPDGTLECIDNFFGSFWFSVVLNYMILLFSSILYASTGEINAPFKERKNSIYSAILIVSSTISILKDASFSDGVSFCEKFIILLLLIVPYLIIIGAMGISYANKTKDWIVSKLSNKPKNKE